MVGTADFSAASEGGMYVEKLLDAQKGRQKVLGTLLVLGLPNAIPRMI